MNKRFDELRASGDAAQERFDCSVIALAASLDIDYVEAHAALLKVGRRRGKGVSDYIIKAALAQFHAGAENVKPSTFINRYPKAHKALKHVTTKHPQRFPQAFADDPKAYLFFTRGHVSCVKGGETIDWAAAHAKRVTKIWEIIV